MDVVGDVVCGSWKSGFVFGDSLRGDVVAAGAIRPLSLRERTEVTCFDSVVVEDFQTSGAAENSFAAAYIPSKGRGPWP